MAAKKRAKPSPTSTDAKPRRTRRKKAAEVGPRGLGATDLSSTAPPADVRALAEAIATDGGAALAIYREPIGGHWAVLAALPIERVAPTPFQRDLSEPHVARLADVIGRLDRFLDPIIAVRNQDGGYWTPNGHHRTEAVRKIGGRAIIALVLPDRAVAYQILALNTEKAHNVREKALEVVRMARSLAAIEPRAERDYALEFEEPPLLTLGLCYEQRARFSGGAYHALLKRIDAFLEEPLPRALQIREARAAKLFALDDAVTAAIEALRAKGLESPYLRAFVVARINPLRFQRGASAPYEATIEKMLASAKAFDAASIRPDHLARAAGPPSEE
jgi:ParB family transcriptional regulator, chromosome partitioning protein